MKRSDNNEDSEKKRAAISSVLAAVLLVSLKIIVGVMTGSLGVLADASHSCLDLVASLVTFIAVRISGEPADEEHPYGHGKVKILGLFETFLLMATCAWIFIEAIRRLLYKAVEVDASFWAFFAMAISIVVDYSRSRILLRVARKVTVRHLRPTRCIFALISGLRQP